MQKVIEIGGERTVAVTDDPQLALLLQKQGPVIGIDAPGTGEGWSGILFLAQSEAAVDAEYAQLAWCRYYGLPRVLTAGNGWYIREAKTEDAAGLKRLYEDPLTARYLRSPLERDAAGGRQQEVAAPNPEKDDDGKQQERTSGKETEAAGMDQEEETAGSLQDWQDWIRGLVQYRYPAETPALWILSDCEDRMLGLIGLEWRGRDGQIPEGYYLGYALLPEARGKKLAAEAASQLVLYCMEYWSLEQIYLLCDSSNIASVKTAYACGFTSGPGQKLIEHSLDDLLHMDTREFLLLTRKRL